jgi:predicted membrane protein
MKYLVPGIELLIIAMIISRYKEAGYYLAFFSLIVFTAYYILFYKVAQSNCGCGKMFDNLGFYPHLSLNIFLLIGSVYLIYHPIQVYPLKNSK